MKEAIKTGWDIISDWDWEEILIIFLVILAVGLVLLVIAAAVIDSGILYDEVENYDFTAQVYDKDHYTTQVVTYVTSGKTRIPVYNTIHHYKIMWEDGNERGELEVGSEHFNKTKIGDFINLHCSVRADKQGELHYYYSYKN